MKLLLLVVKVAIAVKIFIIENSPYIFVLTSFTPYLEFIVNFIPSLEYIILLA